VSSWLDRIEAATAGPAPTAAAAPGVKVVDIDGVSMSARLQTVPEPRAVLVALHGGGASARYFDHPTHPELSLLHIGAALGYTVLAVDRPGYGMSRPSAEEVADPQRRVDLLYATVDELLGSGPRGAGVFLVGHSLGCELAVRMAADERGAGLLGVELAGTGVQYHPVARELMENHRRAGDAQRPTGILDLLFQPAGLYPDDIDGEAVGGRSPGYEGEVSRSWGGDTFPALAARVRVPVRYTIADHESVWATGPAALAEVAALFTASPRVVAEEQAAAGHNLSLGLSARAYHLKVLSFVEECAVLADVRGAGES
jgi:pimeloyl-ACP methyl ester carboxylesterase